MKKKVMMLIIGFFVIGGLPRAALCEDGTTEIIEAAADDTGPPFVEEIYTAINAGDGELQTEIVSEEASRVAADGLLQGQIDAILAAQPSEGEILLPHYSDVEGSGAIHMTATGAIQGDILGSVTATGKENSILLTRFVHEVVQAFDPVSGFPTGRRQHQPITITKAVDKSSPHLYAAFINAEELTTVKFEFYRIGEDGVEELYFTTELVSARIVGVEWDRGPQLTRHKEREHISYCYQKIIWTYTDGGISSEDDWETPNTED
jgi:type VI secretion system secreted protein Hcp